jgi:YaiO family outer membrane protein
MPKSFILSLLIIVLSGLLSNSLLYSQEIGDPEAEYFRVRTMAFEGDYSGASAAARRLVNAYPEYGDARVLLARILAWQKDYKQAEAVIDTLLMTEPNNTDALAVKKDISLWSKEYTPVATDLRAGYFFDTFSEPYNRFWQVFKAGAGHRFGFGPAYAGINIGNIRIGEPDPLTATEIQMEAETWPTLTAKNYAYLAYAYSPGTWFPRHRAAVELWQVLPDGWALSAGLNYYYFTRSIYIGTLSAEKYLGKFWFSARGYFYFKDEGVTTSFYLTGRRYFNDTDYLQVVLGTGTAPDEPFDVQADLMRLSAQSIRLAYNVVLTNKLMMRIGAGYSSEEYEESVWRNRFEGGVNFTYAIRMK